jgi:hypothetical protein
VLETGVAAGTARGTGIAGQRSAQEDRRNARADEPPLPLISMGKK